MPKGFFYYHADHQGSITHLTNTSGAIANSYVYDSYGQTLSVVEAVPQPFTYTGRELDPESGLYYYRARYYDPTAGRFLSEDPIGFRGGANFYRYVRNNPLNFIDPFGLCPDPPRSPTRNEGADKAAQKQGFKDAEGLKNDVTSGQGKNFNTNVDKSTGEIILTPVNKGSGPNIPTGMLDK